MDLQTKVTKHGTTPKDWETVLNLNERFAGKIAFSFCYAIPQGEIGGLAFYEDETRQTLKILSRFKVDGKDIFLSFPFLTEIFRGEYESCLRDRLSKEVSVILVIETLRKGFRDV